jgi:hypothetical protein
LAVSSSSFSCAVASSKDRGLSPLLSGSSECSLVVRKVALLSGDGANAEVDVTHRRKRKHRRRLWNSSIFNAVF